MLLATLLVAIASQAAPTVTAGDLETLSVHELARRTLPPSEAAEVVGGTTAAGRNVYRNYGATFWEVGVPIAAFVCRREVHSMNLWTEAGYQYDHGATRRLRPRAPATFLAFKSTFPRRASQESCDDISGYVRSSLNGGPEQAVEALNTLAGILARAAADRPLPFDLSCSVQIAPDPCPAARSLLAAMSVSDLARLNQDRKGRLVFTFRPQSPSGGNQWEVAAERRGLEVTRVRMFRHNVIIH